MSTFHVNDITAGVSTNTWIGAHASGAQPRTKASSLEATQLDTATTSTEAQAVRLHEQGVPDSAIATILGTNLAEIEGYFNISSQSNPTIKA